MKEYFEIHCECGLKDLRATSYEKDSTWSSYTIWAFENVDCTNSRVEGKGVLNIKQAIETY